MRRTYLLLREAGTCALAYNENITTKPVKFLSSLKRSKHAVNHSECLEITEQTFALFKKMENNLPAENIEIDRLENAVEELIEDWMFDAPFQDAFPESDSSSDSDSSDSSDEDEVPERRRKVYIRNYVENTVPLYAEDEFKSHFRLERQSAYNLIERFEQTNFHIINEDHEDAVKHERAFLMTLWYLANTETFRQVADRFNLSRSSAHRILLNTLDFLNSLTEEYIRFPMEEDEKETVSRSFARIQNIHGIIGAIDGCHVRIRRPVEHQEDYVNRKRYHSVILQAVVTSKKLFTDVYIGEPGSMHDARVLRRSPLYEKALEEPEFFGNYFLLGDSAYPNLQWLVPPFRDNGRLNRQQRLFNYRHAATRVRVEQAFGLLRARFRRLIRFDNLRIDIIVQCIMAACILHNICILNNAEPDSDDSCDDDNNDDGNCAEQNNDDQNDGVNGENRNIHDDNENGDANHDVDRRLHVFNRMFRRNNACE